MEEKKVIKISLSNFLLIITIISILVMTYFIYKITNEKNTIEKENNDLKTKTSTVENIKEENNTDIKNNITSEKIENNSSDKKIYTFDEVTGVYEYKVKSDKDGESIFHLELNNNGTFHYTQININDYGKTGNYVIDNDTIILNDLFEHGTQAAVTAITGTRKLEINNDGTIKDNNKKDLNLSTDISSITLKKVSNSVTEDFLNQVINNFYISNKVQK